MKDIMQKLQRFLEGRLHMLIALALAMVLTVFSMEHYAIPIFVLWIVFVLVVDANFTDILLPLALLNAMAIRTIGQTTYHEKHLWLAIPVLIGIVLHFVIFPRKITIGKSFFPLCAVSAALLLGGVGVISKEEYFSVSSLYFTVLLGVGMLFFYLWMRGHMYSTESYDLAERVLEILYLWGAFCAFSILEKALRMLIGYGSLISFGWCNDICEMMIFALPVPFFFARRNFVHFFVPFFFYLAMIPAKSMTAIGVGAVMLFIGVIYAFVYCPQRRRDIALVAAFAAVIALAVGWKYDILTFEKFMAFVRDEENGRSTLIKLAWENFIANPLQGAGMGAGNTTSNVLDGLWTHNYFAQILGSMGIIGALAFGYQLVARARIIFCRRNALRYALALSYLGIFLASMMQPGEFAPMPYELYVVMLFVVLEKTENGRCPRLTAENT